MKLCLIFLKPYLMRMKTGQDNEYTEKMLAEAMELLMELRPNMGMFQRQYYCRLKNRFDQHLALGAVLHAALRTIETE